MPDPFDVPAEPGGTFGGGGGGGSGGFFSMIPGSVGPGASVAGLGGGDFGFPGMGQQQSGYGGMRRRPMGRMGSGRSILSGGGGFGRAQGAQPAWMNQGTWDWGYSPDPGFENPVERAFNSIFQNAGKGGVYDPTGSSALRDMLRSKIQGDSQGRGRALQMRARADATVDPSSYGSLALRSQMQGGADTADALSNADIQTSAAAQDWLRQIASAYQQSRLGAQSANQQNWISNEQYNRQNQGGLGGALGGILGRLGGSIFGGGGQQQQGGARMGQPGYEWPR